MNDFTPPPLGMFLRSVQLGNFVYYSVGALKQFCWKTFFAIDELYILKKIKSFHPPPPFK